MPELKPCPFCGEKAEIMEYSDRFQCGCKDEDCIAWVEEMRVYLTRSEAIKDWNTRAERTCRVVPMDAAGNPPYRKGDLILNELTDGCSKCGYPFDTLNHGVPNYCSNCGAKVIHDANV